ncbi:hypothetical protein ES705_08820 [subsurface metagenome]
MDQYEVIYQATVLGVAKVTAKSDKAAERIVRKGGRIGPSVEFLEESHITQINWEQALAIPARS